MTNVSPIAPRHDAARRWLCAAILVACVVATFWRTCGFEFVGGWDDRPLIVDNPLINPPTASGLAKIWKGPHERMYIPVVYSTWWGLAHLAHVSREDMAGLDPWVFHTANLIVHVGSALLVFAILKLLVGDDLSACAGAIIFAIHPLQVEPVVWATGMKDLLCGFFSFLAIWQYLQSTQARGRGTFWAHHGIATAALCLAILAKPSAVMVPAIVLVLDLLIIRRSWREVMASIVPWLLIAVAGAVIATMAQPTPEIVPAPIWQRPIIAIDAIGFYLTKLAWPARLCIDYGLKPNVIIHARFWIATLIGLALIIAARRRWLTAAGLIFVLGMLPVLGLTPFVFEWASVVADRYAYLSMLGPAMAVAFILARTKSPAAWIVAAIVIVALSTAALVQARVWSDGQTLMQYTLTINPNSPAAHNQLGDAEFRDGHFAAAYLNFETAVREKPDYLVARDNLASALVRLGRFDEAIDVMKQTLAKRRALPASIRQPIDKDLSRIATALMLDHRLREAVAYWSELAKLKPDDAAVQRAIAHARSLSTQPTTPFSATGRTTTP